MYNQHSIIHPFAMDYLSHKVTHAAVTVPACQPFLSFLFVTPDNELFSEFKRQVTRDAGTIAGLYGYQ